MKKRSHAHRFPPTAETPQSLAELLVAALAENERLAKLVDELRREIVALKRETIALRDRLRALGREGVVAACADVASGDTGWRAFYARFCLYIAKYRSAAGKAGAFVRRYENFLS